MDAATFSASTYVLRAYCLLAAAVLGVFGVWRIGYGPYALLGFLEALAGISVAIAGLVWTTKKEPYVRSLLLCVMLLFLGITLITGGMHEAGILWFYAFPVAAFFLTGRKEGALWATLLFAVIVGVGVCSAYGVVGTPYELPTFIQLIGSLLVVTVGTYIYQLSREQLTSQTIQSRTELETEKMRSDVILQSLAEGIVVTDATGAITYVNQAAEKLLGWNKHELLGANIAERIPAAASVATKQGRMPLSAKIICKRKDGKQIPVALTHIPFISGRRILGSITTFRDIHDEEDILRAKSEFVTLASHQLRTPISAIAWVSELLLGGDSGKLSAEQRTHIADIYQSNKRLSALVSEMLIVSSLDLQSLPVVPQEVNLAALIKSVVQEQAAAFEFKDQQAKEHYDESVPAIKCDPEIMRTILRNLLSNAFKYTPPKGTITVRLRVDHATKLRQDSKGSIAIEVSDTGYGIPEQVTHKVFGKFFRGENIVHKDTDGTGLGLHIAKALLDYVGGRISFVSKEKKGSIFTVLLPLEGMAKRKVPSIHSQPALHLEEESRV